MAPEAVADCSGETDECPMARPRGHGERMCRGYDVQRLGVLQGVHVERCDMGQVGVELHLCG